MLVVTFYATYCAKYFKCIIQFNIHDNLMKQGYYSHFTNEAMEVYNVGVTGPRCQSWCVSEQGFEVLSAAQ